MRTLVFSALAAAALVLPPAMSAQAAAPSRGTTYVAMGASDGVGIGALDPSRGWVPVFAELLGPETRVHNLGVSGTLLNYALTEQLPAAIEAQPDVVTVWLAVNDFNWLVSLESYAADLDYLLGRLERETDARVLVGNIPDLSQVALYGFLDPGYLRGRVQRWNDRIEQVAERHGATVVDLYAAWQELAQHPEYVARDGFHPSERGYARMAELFFAAAHVPVG